MLPFEAPLIDEGIEYLSVENYYQAMKTLDIDRRKEIAQATPMQSKKLGRGAVMRSDWEGIKQSVMEIALRHKFSPGTKWYDQLIKAEGEIVEWNNWGDEIWGIDVRTNKGQNLLGKLLMKFGNEFLLTEKLS